MSWRDAPLYVEAHDLSRWLLERARAWDSPNDSLLGRRMTSHTCEVVEKVALALTFPATRAQHLEAVDHRVVTLRMQLRLAVDLGLLSAGAHRYAAGRLDAVGRMLGGWRKRLARRRSGQPHDSTGSGPPAARGA